MVAIIAAVAKNDVIGKDGGIPWYIPDDFKRFKKLTTGHVLIMGRKTYESIGRPLPDRETIVLSRSAPPLVQPESVSYAASLEEALVVTGKLMRAMAADVFICGGAEVYREALEKDVADKMYITWIDADYEGDTKMPAVDPKQWNEIAREDVFLAPDARRPELKVPPEGLRYSFVEYERVR